MQDDKNLDYAKISTGKIDSAILWNYNYFNDSPKHSIFSKIFQRRVEHPNEKTIADIRTQLSTGFDKIYTSQSGLLELYRKNR